MNDSLNNRFRFSHVEVKSVDCAYDHNNPCPLVDMVRQTLHQHMEIAMAEREVAPWLGVGFIRLPDQDTPGRDAFGCSLATAVLEEAIPLEFPVHILLTDKSTEELIFGEICLRLAQWACEVMETFESMPELGGVIRKIMPGQITLAGQPKIFATHPTDERTKH